MAAGLLILAHGAVWWWATSRIVDAWPGFIAQARDYGWSVTAGQPRRAGWPLTATVGWPDLVATRPAGPATIQLRLARLDLTLDPLDPGALQAEAPGTHALVLGDGQPLAIHTAANRLRLPFGPDPAAFTARGLEATTAGQGASADTLEIRLQGPAATLAITGLQTLPRLAAPFDGGGALSLRTLVTPPIPLAGSPAAAAALWQQAGGRAEFPELTLRWGPLAAEARLSARLDPALQPTLDGSVQLAGATELLDAASAAGLVARPVTQAARAVLGIMTLAAGGRAVRLPFSLANGTLVVAQFPLARLPRIEWADR